MKLFSRFAALALALMLCLSILPAAVAEDVTQDKNQIVNAGGTVYYNETGTPVTSTGLGNNGAVVEMTKTVSQPEGYQENEFEITLQVKTTSRIDTITSTSDDMAVLLIMDLSNSMTWAYDTSFFGNKTRLDAAKEAAKAFINQFASLQDANGNTVSGRRMVGLVTFGTNAGSYNWNLHTPDTDPVFWIDVSNSANLTKVVGKSDGFFWEKKGEIGELNADQGGTNLKGALMAGRNLLNDGLQQDGAIYGIEHVFTILLTDGNPTFSVHSEYEKSTSHTYIGGHNDGTGSTTNLKDVKDIGDIANAIKQKSKLYSICFGLDTDSDGNTKYYYKDLRGDEKYTIYPNEWKQEYYTKDIYETTPFDKWDDANPATKKDTTIGDWLGAFSDVAYNGQASTTNQNLFDLAFKPIIQQIKLSIEAWQVEDTMGPNVEWIGEVPVQYKNGSSIIVNVTNSTNSATLNKVNNKLQWNILKSGNNPDPEVTKLNANPPVVGYTYKYKVRLNNLDGDYKAGTTETPTNTSATLKYAVLKDGVFQANPNNTTDGTYTGTFPQPKVQGLVGNLTFKKVDGSGTALPGATFELRLDTEKDKTGTLTPPLTATSGANGTVTFSNIPSGHKYKLVETTVPTGYTGAANIDLSVSYGEVDYTNFSGTADDHTVVNIAKTGTLTIKKTNTGATPQSVTFTVTRDGETTSYATFTLPENGQWEKTLENVPIGNYTVTEKGAEVNGYTLTTTVTGLTNGKASVTSGNTATVAFTNNYEKNTGSLKIEKGFTFSPAPSTSPAPVPTPTAITMVVTEVSPAPSTTPYTTEVILRPDSWTATVDNLPVGSYMVTEKTDGAQISGWTLNATTSGAVTVASNTTAPTVTITNTYERDTGSLKISKTNEGATPDSVKFTVSGPDGYSAEVTLPIVGADGSKSWSTTLENLPTGTYTIIETDANINGYTLTTSSNLDTNNQVNLTTQGATVTFANKYAQDVGSLTVSKAWAYKLGTQATPAPSNAPSQVTVNVVGPTSTSAILNAENNWSTTIPYLPVGSYTVTEDQTGLAIEGWTLDVTGGNPSTSPAPVTKGTNATAATITNTYSRDTGSLTITKKNEGATPDSVKFTVSGPDGYSAEVTLSAANSWTTTLENLPTGTYTITESSAGVDGYSYTTKVKVNNGTESENTSTSTSVTRGGKTTVAFTNTYTQNKGGLVIKKDFSFQYNGNATAAPAPTPAVIQVQVAPAASNGPTVSMTPFPVDLTANNSWTATVDNLPVGSYTVTEKTDGAQISGWTLNATTSGAVTVASNTTAPTVEITNTYTRDTGSLTIKKEFTTSPETTARPTEITVNVSGYATPIKLNAANGWTYTIENLPTGTYTVTEDTSTAAITDYTLTSTTYSAVEGKVTVTKGETAQEITITNAYTQNKGGLTISKTFNFVTPSPMVGTVTTPAPSDRPEIVVEVKDASNQPVATATLNSDNSWTAAISDLPVGDYTVTEVNSTEHPLTINGWTLVTPAPTTVKVASNTTAPTVTITNTYERDTGKLTIVKTFNTAVINFIPADAEVKVTVTGLNNDYNETVTLSYSNRWTVVLENLPTGTYTVKEISYPTINDFIFKGTTYNKQSLENGLTATVTKLSPFFVTIDNTYEKLAELTIKKEFAGDLTADDFAGKNIEFTVSGDNLDSAKTVTLNKANNWVNSIKLPAGEYTVTETAPVEVGNYSHTVSYKQGEVTDNANKVKLDEGATVTVTATNTYTEDVGELTIKKVFDGLPTGIQPASVKFTVTGPSPATTSREVTLTSENSWESTITLPIGTYTVVEQSDSAKVNDYTYTVSYTQTGKTENANTVDITKGATVAVKATNTYTRETGSLTIKKEFSNLPENSKPQSIIIQVFGPTNSNFETTVLLNAANNWTDTISNLPAGVYTVTENTDNAIVSGYDFTTTVKVGDGDAEAMANTTATVPAGGNVTVTFTNAYSLKEAKKIELPITKVVTRGEKGNVDPTGARTFTFVAQIEELILGSLDDTPAVQPGEIVVRFNDETLTPKDNLYTFSITVNGVGEETGKLTIFTNEVSYLIVNVRELSQTDSGYAEDECWKYDESSYEFNPSINNSKDDINDKDYYLNGVHVISEAEGFQLSEDDAIIFTNVYTKTSTPEIDVPVTGDNSHMGLYMAMMVLSAAGVVLLLKRRSAQR